MENTTLAKMGLTGDAFQDGQPIPVQYTCDGAGQTPILHWNDPPAGTKSFALAIDDPDAQSGTFRHWGVFDIPASARSIGGGERLREALSRVDLHASDFMVEAASVEFSGLCGACARQTGEA